MDWISSTQCFISSNCSPLVLLHFPFGVFGQGALGLVKEHVRCKKYQAAIKVLYSINWNTSASIAYAALTTILDSLFVQPLNYNRETYIENCLAAFYNPARPLSDLIVLEFRDHILRYARRFFHHLLRHRRLQKSFLLAIDIGAQDLFLDVHHMALHYKGNYTIRLIDFPISGNRQSRGTLPINGQSLFIKSLVWLQKRLVELTNASKLTNMMKNLTKNLITINQEPYRDLCVMYKVEIPEIIIE